jgi:hypothetical protein
MTEQTPKPEEQEEKLPATPHTERCGSRSWRSLT